MATTEPQLYCWNGIIWIQIGTIFSSENYEHGQVSSIRMDAFPKWPVPPLNACGLSKLAKKTMNYNLAFLKPQ